MNVSKIKKIFYGICIVAVMAMLFFGYEAYDKKNNYYNSEYSTSHNENAYVGGDAYNYIINAGYFAGYAALSGASAVTAVLSFGCGTMLMCVESFLQKEGEGDAGVGQTGAGLVSVGPGEDPCKKMNEEKDTRFARTDEGIAREKNGVDSRKQTNGEKFEQIVVVLAAMAVLVLLILMYAGV